ncbi:SCO0930 family lipoprotein [Streptomyces sp. NPDC090306]|uniref:SCO0930 family lipoprotein n=1 Tax=unclassified Streptomyces TaxID=2593676 RepID=UPI0036DFDD45
MQNSWRSAALAATAAVVLALTAACGQGGATGSAGGARAGAAAVVGNGADDSAGGADAQDAGAAAKPAGRLAVSAQAKLGNVVTDGSGLTLYRFDDDLAEPPTTNCDGPCATSWPPVPADDAKAGAGIDEALLGSVTRSDGTRQLTVAGWPAYRYAKDTAAGQINGQGVAGSWYALAPDGKKAAPAAASGLPGLSVRKDARLGDIVVDHQGRTVYRFLEDEAWPVSKSACTGACLEKWPAVAPVKAADTEGVRKKGLMGFTRPDGVKQMTVNCWPVYTFSGDTAAGDTNGQGVGGTWYAVAPDGKPVGAPAAK